MTNYDCLKENKYRLTDLLVWSVYDSALNMRIYTCPCGRRFTDRDAAFVNTYAWLDEEAEIRFDEETE